MKKTLALLFVSAFTALSATAQDAFTAQSAGQENRLGTLETDVAKLKKLKVSGYIQGQFLWGEEAASLKVGSSNENPEESFNRLGIRRGRIKFTYDSGVASAVFQLDVTEKGVGFKDAYLNLRDPWIKSLQLRAGVFDRPFGYEISYSSSRRESPERSAVFQTLFPDERDLGAMLVLQAPQSSSWSILKLEAGLFAGNGIKQETDSKKDFIGHLSVAKNWGNVSFGLGASYYNGRVYQSSPNVYTMNGNAFVLNDNAANQGKFAKREYIGIDAQFGVKSILGTTRINGEYLFGQQPGVLSGSKSPNSSTLPATPTDTYIRDFNGGYAMLVHEIAKTPVGIVAKYDWYDPNTEVSGNSIGQSSTGKADISKNTWGMGALWSINPDIRLTAYYEFNSNEKSDNLAGFGNNINDDVFTLRLQYKF